MKHVVKLQLTVIASLLFCNLSAIKADSVEDFTQPNARIEMAADRYPDLTNLTLSVWIKTDTKPGNYAAIAGCGYLGVMSCKNDTIGFIKKGG